MSLLFPKIEKNENAMAYGQPEDRKGKIYLNFLNQKHICRSGTEVPMWGMDLWTQLGKERLR